MTTTPEDGEELISNTRDSLPSQLGRVIDPILSENPEAFDLNGVGEGINTLLDLATSEDYSRDALNVFYGAFDALVGMLEGTLRNEQTLINVRPAEDITAHIATKDTIDSEAATRLIALIDPAAAIATQQAEARTIPLAPIAAALAPLILFLLWFGRRRAQLNRQRPEVAPLHDRYILDAAGQAERWTRREHDAARLLQQRDERPVNRLSVPDTIAATLRGGGHIVAPRYQTLRPAPEYLVLIERRGPDDQEAQNLRQLIEPFRSHHVAGFVIYWVQGSLASVIPERGGAAVPLATLRTRHPDHRLILLGSGRDWAGAGVEGPGPDTLALRDWDRRAMLTPVPVDDWGATEPRLAEALDMVVGRATSEGMAQIGAYLGLGDQSPPPGPRREHDQSAHVVPPLIRLNRYEMLAEAAPDKAGRTAIIEALRGYLDAKGFQWLAALCVYPATQWDLTFYLGRERVYRTDDPLYSDDIASDRRLGQLAQLPWLQAGYIPGWLRRALIAELSADEAGMVYATLCDVLTRARNDDGTRDPELRLRIGRNRPVDPLAQTPLEDMVMLDFLDRGARGDFILPPDFKVPDEARPRALVRQPGVRRMAAGAIALAAVSAWIAPPGPAVTGGWLPLIALFGGSALIMLALGPRVYSAAAGDAASS